MGSRQIGRRIWELRKKETLHLREEISRRVKKMGEKVAVIRIGQQKKYLTRRR